MIKQYKEKPLNIYRASAGSGKTFLLTGFYIKLLFNNELCPETHSGEMKFSEILAVTFTNKATAEMKGRIIKELYKLSIEPQKSDYWKDIVPQGTSTDDSKAIERISRKATQLLIQILNEYSSFNISTIDSFFQKIVRSFARELNIPGSYEVQLDASTVFDAAVSAFLDELSPEDKHLYNWMVDFSRNRISEGSGWDFRSALIDMSSKILSSETYRQHSQAIQEFTSDKDAMYNYIKMLKEIQRNWKETMKQLGEEGLRLMSENGITSSQFKYGGSGSVQLFAKWANGEETKIGPRFSKGIEDPKSLYKDFHPSQNFQDTLQQLMQRCCDHMTGSDYTDYCTARAIRKYFYELGILANIDKAVTRYCNEQNVMLINSTNELLSQLIGQDDAPFIYEKTGSRIHSYMIDEFQDTSGMQWNNFKPLVSNALAEQYQNLIVGDVKQSIYRWRGGDWNLLNSEINSYETALHYDDKDSLSTNWRSLPAIVGFNNDFFPTLATQLDNLLGNGSTQIQSIYADVHQELPDKKKGNDYPQGLVQIRFLEPEGTDGKPKAEDYLTEAARRLPEVIIELQQRGFEPKDIAILCRYNKECRWAAEVILRYKQEHPECTAGLDIISSEALELSARPVIHVLINLMRHLQSPESQILCTIARTSLMQLEGMTSEQALEHLFAIPEEQRAFHRELAHRPLYEMCEELINLLPPDVCTSEAPFLQAFRDAVLEYSSMKSSDLSGFINWWDQSGHKKSITTPEGLNAIQILSVHKSKGLGMPAIVMPFASWNIDIDTSHSEILWCEPKKEPFKQNVLLPVKLETSLADTIFADDYNQERMRAVIDNFNTVYVALTRAMEAMVLLTPMPQKEDGTRLEHWLLNFCKRHGCSNEFLLGDGLRMPKEASEDTGKEGTEEKSKNEIGETETNNPSADSSGMESCVPQARNALPSITILHDPAKPDITAKERGTYIHAVLQDIRTADEATDVIHRLYLRGDIDAHVIAEAEMHASISNLLSVPEVQSWFRPGLQILNELTLMDSQGKMQRPDRIIIDEEGTATVIDYKTGSNHNSYSEQVRGYMRILRQMGFKQVDGYLLFLKNKQVKRVTLK